MQFKLEILLDMVCMHKRSLFGTKLYYECLSHRLMLLLQLTTSTAEQHLQTKQIDELKNMIRSKGSVKTR